MWWFLAVLCILAILIYLSDGSGARHLSDSTDDYFDYDDD